MPQTHHTYELEIAEGLEAIAADELREHQPSAAVTHTGKGLVQFTYTGDPRYLLGLKTVIAVYALQTFPVPRPKALLGHQHFTTITAMIDIALRLASNAYATLYIDAAGSESSVMTRLKHELATYANLTSIDEKGDLLLRVRRGRGGEGWDVLVRLTPRPLATREWRVANYEGALNASVAHAMIRLMQPQPADTFVNLVCGSGSLLIERGAFGNAAHLIGVEIDPAVLSLAQANLDAAKLTQPPTLIHGDATRLPLPDASVNALAADLPFGQLVGSQAENAVLYPALLQEAARVAQPDAVFVVITHALRLMDKVLPASPAWHLADSLRVTLGGLHPRIYLLHRRLDV